MDIQANDYQIKITHDELWSLSFNVRRSLYDAFKTHWILHQKSWKKNEEQRLNSLKKMFYALGRPDLFDEIEVEAIKIFDEFNKKT
jgi:hypothetical protein